MQPHEIDYLARSLAAAIRQPVPQAVCGGILDKNPAELGGRVRLEPSGATGTDENPLTGFSSRMMAISAEDKSKTQTYVLSFDLTVEGATPAVAATYPVLTNMLIRARLQWGSPKGKGEAVIDVKHGTRLTLEGTSLVVDIEVVFDNSVVVAANNDGPVVHVYGSVGLGSIGKGPQLTFTSQAQAINSGALFLFPIPAYAREIEIQNNGDPFAAIATTFNIDILSSPIAGGRLITRHGNTNQRITIPNGAGGVQVTNRGPANTIITPIYHLAL